MTLLSQFETWNWLANVIIRATIVLTLVATADFLFTSRKRFLTASAVWYAGLVALLLVPVLGLLIPSRTAWIPANRPLANAQTIFRPMTPIPDLISETGKTTTSSLVTQDTQRVSQPELGTPGASQIVGTNDENPPKKEATSLIVPVNQSLKWKWQNAIGLVLGFGYLVMAIRLGRSWYFSKQLKVHSTPHPDKATIGTYNDLCQLLDIASTRSLLVNDAIKVPMVIGVFRPCVVLPRCLSGPLATASQSVSVRAMLLHELTHIKRRDPMWNLILEVVVALYWFHPLVWFSRKRVAALREKACDDFCIQKLGGAAEYSDTLIAIASNLTCIEGPALHLAAVRQSNLAKRILDINRSTGNRQYLASKTARSLVAATAFACVLLITSISVFETQAMTSPTLRQEETGVAKSKSENPFDFSATQREEFARILEIGENEVQDKTAVLTMLADKSKENYDKIKTWEGKFERKTQRVFPDMFGNNTRFRYSDSGYYYVDNQQDSIFLRVVPETSVAVDQVTGSERTDIKISQWSQSMIVTPVFCIEIMSPETVQPLPANSGVSGRKLIRHRKVRKDDGNQADPRRYFHAGGWLICEYLKKQLEYQSEPGFWDRASLSKIDGPEGVEYRLRALYKSGPDTFTDLTEMCFSESAGFQLTANSVRLLDRPITKIKTLEYEYANGVFLPKRVHEIDEHVDENGNMIRTESNTLLTLSRLNDGTSLRSFNSGEVETVFCIEQLDPQEGDLLIDVFHRTLSEYQNGEFEIADPGNFPELTKRYKARWKVPPAIKH